MARLFSAIELPREIAQDLEMMRGGIEGARWIDRENYARHFDPEKWPVAGASLPREAASGAVADSAVSAPRTEE